MKHLRLLSILIACGLCIGCTVRPIADFADHAIRINGDGDIVPVVQTGPLTVNHCGPTGSHPSTQFASQAVQDYQSSIQQILLSAAASNRDLLIFFHGGLVSFDDSTERTNLLVERYDCDANDLLDGYYPITINWDSSLTNSYLEHLAFVRQGVKWSGPAWRGLGILTSPLYFLADIGRSLARAPINVLYNAAHNIGAIPSIRNSTSSPAINSNILYGALRKGGSLTVSEGSERTMDLKTAYKVPVNVVTFPVQAVIAPFVDGLGTPAWENMERRTKNIDNKPDEFDIRGSTDPQSIGDALNGLPESVMDEFASQLVDFQKAHPKIRITLVAHSMGAFIVNDLLQRTSDVEYANIIYMAGADSIRNTFDSVLPYLTSHPETQFYNLTLHPQAEIEEAEGWGLAPRGSLLVWIDDFFSSPLAFLDRTVGRWENIIQAYGEIDQNLRPRVHIKAFDQTSTIKKHGDFGSACFWQHEFWDLGPDGQDGWKQPSYQRPSGNNFCNRSK